MSDEIVPPPAPRFGGAKANDKEWERKQRAQEYRVATRREKRNRKADEKKQRKLNATILRRMTRNPDKYTKNADRNRLRAVVVERRRIWRNAVIQAQNLAAEHDPTGASFNVSPVVRLDDGQVITQDAFQRRQERQAEKEALEKAQENGIPMEIDNERKDKKIKEAHEKAKEPPPEMPANLVNGFHPDRAEINPEDPTKPPGKRISKRQQKKQAILEPRPAPPRPTIPENIVLPEGEENWLALWDLSDEQLEKRVNRETNRKARERKALRIRQQTGKAERRLARDEKRNVYRDIKLEWKSIKEEQVRHRTRLRALEDEESKRIAVLINEHERITAMKICSSHGFTLENTPGVDEIQPKAQGMKGKKVNFDLFEKSEKYGDIKLKEPKPQSKSKRVDLGAAAPDAQTQFVGAGSNNNPENMDEFIEFDFDNDDQDHETLAYNHRLRRKLRRALDYAEVQKELLVRERTIEYLKSKDREVPEVLRSARRPQNKKGHRILESGKFETPKQERVRARVELTEFNNFMKVLRRQAKETAIYAGLKKYAEATGQQPVEISTESSTMDVKPVSSDINGEAVPREEGGASDTEDDSFSDTEEEAVSDAELMSEAGSASDTSMLSDSDSGRRKRRKTKR